MLAQLEARRNMYRLQDRRAFAPRIDGTLALAARVWPGILPWKPKTILDIGAHRGSIAEQLSVLYHPSFFGLVEPIPHLAAALEKRCFAPRQKVFQCALGRNEGRALLNILANLPSSSLLEPSPRCESLFNVSMETTARIQVPIRKLDEVFSECDVEFLDLLKIDVQGYELEVLTAGTETLKRTRLIVIEVSFFEHYIGQPLFGEMYRYLVEMGFELRGTFGYIFDSLGTPLQCDAILVNRVLLGLGKR